MKPIITSCISVLLFALSAFAADNAVFAAREAKIEKATQIATAEIVTTQAAQIDHDLAATPGDPALMYFRAYAHFAEGCVARAHKDKAGAAQHMEAAEKLLEQINNPAWQAEACGLQGYVLNQLIGVKGMEVAMEYGPKSAALLAQAGGMAPENPRILFFRGVALVTTPEQWGGDIVQGAKLLEQATAAFEHPAKNALVRWGQGESLVWLGIAKQKAGDTGAARAAWQKALQLEPNYGWVKYGLLPSLDAKAEQPAK
jgi:tetratricopeptide (TPR) repeat protein